jgi:hypothetical protein
MPSDFFTTTASNEKMIANRYANWARYRRAFNFIKSHAERGGTVYLSTALKITTIKAKHLPLVVATRSGLYVKHGKQWLCYMDRGVSCRISAD